MKLVMLGAPGAGKGTQAEILSKKLGIPCISTGEMLRMAVRNCTSTGIKAKKYMNSGGLVPDEVVIGIVNERVRLGDCRGGYILDGMPRTVVQAEALERGGITIDAAISIEIADAEVEARMTGRRSCPYCGATYHIMSKPPKVEGICDNCGSELTRRQDDEPETVKSRLVTYHLEAGPLKEFYRERGRLKMVDDTPSIDVVAAQIAKALGIEND